MKKNIFYHLLLIAIALVEHCALCVLMGKTSLSLPYHLLRTDHANGWKKLSTLHGPKATERIHFPLLIHSFIFFSFLSWELALTIINIENLHRDYCFAWLTNPFPISCYGSCYLLILESRTPTICLTSHVRLPLAWL